MSTVPEELPGQKDRAALWGPIRFSGRLENGIYQQPSYSWDVPGGVGRGQRKESGEQRALRVESGQWWPGMGRALRPAGARAQASSSPRVPSA